MTKEREEYNHSNIVVSLVLYYTFDDKVKIRIYEDFEVDFTKLKL